MWEHPQQQEFLTFGCSRWSYMVALNNCIALKQFAQVSPFLDSVDVLKNCCCNLKESSVLIPRPKKSYSQYAHTEHTFDKISSVCFNSSTSVYTNDLYFHYPVRLIWRNVLFWVWFLSRFLHVFSGSFFMPLSPLAYSLRTELYSVCFFFFKY